MKSSWAIFIIFLTVLSFPSSIGGTATREQTADGIVSSSLSSVSKNLVFYETSDTITKILFDEAHTTLYGSFIAPGPVSMMGGFLNELGFETDVNMFNSLTPEYLDDYDILAIFLPQSTFSETEVQAILDFVDSGGSLLVTGTSVGYPGYHVSSNLNLITEPLKVIFSDAIGPLQYIQSFLNHPLSTGISKLLLLETGKFSIDPGADVQILANFSTGDPALAFRNYGLGKVFFSSTGDVFSNLKGPEKLKGSEHFQFLANVFNWLAGESINVVNEPGWMQIPVRKEYTTTETERRNYQMLLGVTHVHSKEGSSDSGEPVANQIEKCRDCDLDFMTITDHQSDYPQLSWQPADDYLVQNNITDLNIIHGVEEDSVHLNHNTVFGITEIQKPGSIHSESEWLDTYNTYKEQGGLVIQAHPQLSRLPLAIQKINEMNYTTLFGLDGFEICNSGFFANEEGGIGEIALLYPFTGGSDAHSIYKMNRSLMYVFVEENTDEAIVEAILDRRSIVVDYYQDVYSSGVWVGPCYQNLTIGDQQWLDEFSYRNETARSQYGVVSELIANASLAGWDVTEANSLLQKAKRSIRNLNYDKAIRLFEEILDSLYSISVATDDTEYDALDEINVNISVKDPSENAVPFTAHVELLDMDHKTVIDSQSGENMELAVLSIPANISSGDYRINVQLTVNGTLYINLLSVTIASDTMEPVVEFVGISDGDIFASSSIDLQWTGSDEGSGIDFYEIYVDDSLITSLTTTSYTLNLGAGDGNYSIEILAFDLASNHESTGKIIILVDTTDPVVTITSPTVGSTVTDTSVEIIWTVAESGSGLDSIIIFVDGTETTRVTDTSTSSYTLTLEAGTYIIAIRAVDLAGNDGEAEITLTVEIETTTTTTTTTTPTPAVHWMLVVAVILGMATWKKKKKK